MNVGDLIQALSRFDPALTVVFPNLDCTDFLPVEEVDLMTLRTRKMDRFPSDESERAVESDSSEAKRDKDKFGPEWTAVQIT